MRKNQHGPRLIASVVTLAVVVANSPALGSDHADPSDPLMLRRKDGGLTGLFVFPTKGRARTVADPKDGDGMAIILCVDRSLATPPPLKGLGEYTFRVMLDMTSEVRITYPRDSAPPDPDERATTRYGGTVTSPEEIKETAVITMRLDENANFVERSAVIQTREGERPIGIAEDDWFSGVRDDPFIFPMFFGTNVVAMAVHVPYDRLPDRDDFVVWATSERHGSQLDIVGRSQRTQLPRFDFLNTLHPREHVAAITKARDDPTLRQNLSTYLLPTEFRFRSFDLQPDVMIFSKRFPSGYPNGRRLQDDVALLACEQGDCQLYELSFTKPASTESEKYSKYEGGRPTANDKPFTDDFPYLAPPWAEPHPPAPLTVTTKNKIILAVLGLLAVGILALPWALYFQTLKRLRRLARRRNSA